MTLMSKISFPGVTRQDDAKQEYDECELYLVQAKEDREICAVIVTEDRVLFFGEDNTICHGELDYLQREYKIIRKMLPGETLSITV